MVLLKVSKSHKQFFLKVHCPSFIGQNFVKYCFRFRPMEFQEKMLLRFTDLDEQEKIDHNFRMISNKTSKLGFHKARSEQNVTKMHLQ